MTATTQEKHFIKKSARLSKLTVQLNNPARLHKRTYAHTIKQCTDAWSSCVWNPCQSHVHSTNATHAHLLEQPHECLRQLTMMERRRSMLESTSTVTASKTADRWRRHALHTFTADPNEGCDRTAAEANALQWESLQIPDPGQLAIPRAFGFW